MILHSRAVTWRVALFILACSRAHYNFVWAHKNPENTTTIHLVISYTICQILFLNFLHVIYFGSILSRVAIALPQFSAFYHCILFVFLFKWKEIMWCGGDSPTVTSYCSAAPSETQCEIELLLRSHAQQIRVYSWSVLTIRGTHLLRMIWTRILLWTRISKQQQHWNVHECQWYLSLLLIWQSLVFFLLSACTLLFGLSKPEETANKKKANSIH